MNIDFTQCMSTLNRTILYERTYRIIHGIKVETEQAATSTQALSGDLLHILESSVGARESQQPSAHKQKKKVSTRFTFVQWLSPSGFMDELLFFCHSLIVVINGKTWLIDLS